MLEYLKCEANKTFTENGAVTCESTGSWCLDLFATIGALRGATEEEILRRFVRAYAEDPNIAMKILFFARDVRGGLGERRVFRVITNWLAVNEPEVMKKNMAYVAEFGRFDDLFALMDTPLEAQMLGILKQRFELDCEELNKKGTVSLLAKWLPSVNASRAETVKQGKRVAKAFGLNDATYRKRLSALREHLHIIENHLRIRNYTFDYERQCSRALLKYRKAFIRNDKEGYRDFLLRVKCGTATLHADNVAPYELVVPFFTGNRVYDCYCMMKISEEEKHCLNATWESLADFGGEENSLAVVDTSGSMYFPGKPVPAAVALSLGLFFAERNKGVFKNHFIEFSENPQLIEIKGDTFVDRLRYLTTFSKVANTNLEAVFDLILRVAVENQVSQEELPAKLYIISDMEFDCCVDNASLSNFENAKRKYAEHGYQLPEIVFWNVASKQCQQPVTKDEKGVYLVSGVTPRIFSMVSRGQVSPYEYMKEIVGNERYEKIGA